MTACNVWKAILISTLCGAVIALAGLFASLILHLPYVAVCSAAFLAAGILLPLSGAMYQGISMELVANGLPRSREKNRLVRKGRRYQLTALLSVTVSGCLLVAAGLSHDMVPVVSCLTGTVVAASLAIVAAFGPDVAGELAELQPEATAAVPGTADTLVLRRW